MKRKLKIHKVDAFTDHLFGGNPTVIVLDADSLSTSEMQKIAREMNMSETGFVLKSDSADFRLRYFTPPGNEIKFCGHATVGALMTIAKENRFGCLFPGKKFRVETNAGILEMEVVFNKNGNIHFIFDAPKIELVPYSDSLSKFAKACGISLALIDTTKPLMLEKTNHYLYFACPNLNALKNIAPDFHKMTEYAKKDNIVLFCALTNETFDPHHQIHARGFAPLVGVPEDPFTGSMQGGLAAYAHTFELTDADWMGVEQGHFIDRPGFVKLDVVSKNPWKVRLHAEAVDVYSADLIL